MIFLDELKELQDNKYRDFQAKLIPNLDKKNILGIRMPKLRTLSKKIRNKSNFNILYSEFTKDLPHTYYDETNLHILFSNEINDFDVCKRELDKLLPFIDNWASCDLFKPKAFEQEPERAFEYISKCMQNTHTYTCRFGIVMLIYFFLKTNFREEQNDIILKTPNNDYYINMAKAWYVATALTYNFSKNIYIIKEYRLDKWTHNKAIQKCIESLAIPQYNKELLRTFKL